MTQGTRQPLYLQIASRVEAMIEAGSLRAGDRIPSVRHLSLQHRVSVPTVMQAYALLEDRRLIEARPKSGYYVKARLAKGLREPQAGGRTAVSSLDGFASFLSMMRDLSDPSLVPLGAAVPGEELLPVKKLGSIAAGIARRSTKACLDYDPAPGCLKLRKELSRRSLDWGCALDPEDFIITVGASEAIHLALRAATRPGDAVLVEAPVYYGMLNLISRLNLKVVAVPASAGEGPDPEEMRRAVEKHRVAAILTIPNFSNPSGSFMPRENRRKLIELAEEKDIPIIEDDIYGDLPHEGPRPTCLKALDRNDRVMLCGSFSKTLAPGFRVGYIVAGRHRQRVLEEKTAFNLGGASLPALTVAEFLRSGGYERHLRKLRHTYRQQVCKMRERVAEVFPEGTKVSNPRGGFVLWLELPGKVDVLEVFREAREAGISFGPGPLFSPDGGFRHCLRLSCGHPWSDRMESALERLAEIIRRREGRIFSAGRD